MTHCRARLRGDRFGKKGQRLGSSDGPDQFALRQVINHRHISNFTGKQNWQDVRQFLDGCQAGRRRAHDVVGNNAVKLMARIKPFFQIVKGHHAKQMPFFVHDWQEVVSLR